MKALYRLLYYLSILLTSILAGFTLAGAFAGDASPDGFKLMPFIGLVLPILLLANVVSAIYWTVRWRCWVFIPLIAILGNWGYLTRVLQFPLFDSASQPNTESSFLKKNERDTESALTIATYNVNSFNHEHTGFSCKQIAAYMKELGVDIFCFQEFGINHEFGIDSLRTVLLQLAVFSRYPIKEKQLVTYPNSNNCSLWCDIDINGQTIRLFNNHLQTTEVSRNKRKLEKELRADDTDRAERAALTLAGGLHENFKKRAVQAKQINQLISDSPYPTLVCGDFNSLPSSYVYQTVKGEKMNDGFQTCGHGYMYTFRYFKHLLRIDYILHSSEFQGVDYFSPDLEYSDHNPVVMRMRL